jgi:hypothetical protein
VISHKALRHNEDESQGLADVRKVVERLGRDIRDARGVAAGADASHLVLWIDYNSDYKQSSAETVTWQLRPARSAGHYEVIRQVGGSREIVEATYLVSAIAFSYDKPAPNTRLVTAAMTYDAVIGGAATQRTSSFSARLRNVS